MSQGFLSFVFGCVCIFIIGLESCVHEKYVHPIVLLFTFSILRIFTFTAYAFQFCNAHTHTHTHMLSGWMSVIFFQY